MTTRLVYSSDKGRLCPSCGWPATDCRCAQTLNQPVPARHETDGGRSFQGRRQCRMTARLRLESKGRGGKHVTIVDGLPDNQPFLEELGTALKKGCATGGTIRPGAVELAGDVRERLRPLLKDRGFVVKG